MTKPDGHQLLYGQLHAALRARQRQLWNEQFQSLIDLLARRFRELVQEASPAIQAWIANVVRFVEALSSLLPEPRPVRLSRHSARHWRSR